jgi:hypothetical protein
LIKEILKNFIFPYVQKLGRGKGGGYWDSKDLPLEAMKNSVRL